MEKIYSGSVKDIYRYQKWIIFDYSDRYSLFDWGQMPDLIPFKGKSLKKIHKNIYNFLESKRIPTALVNSSEIINDDQLKCLNLKENQILMLEFKRYQCVLSSHEKPHYIAPDEDLLALPLEFIFRYRVHKDSSFFDRLQNKDYRLNLNLDSQIKIEHNAELPHVVIEYFTKLEPQDRWLSKEEALSIINLPEHVLQQAILMTQKIANELKNYFNQYHLTLWDGKIELGWSKKENKIILIDSIGPDELRLTYQNLDFSKEILRSYYRNTDWFFEVKKAKQQYPYDWRKNVKQNPQPLPQEWINWVSRMYEVLSNLDYPSKQISDELNNLVSDYKKLPSGDQ